MTLYVDGTAAHRLYLDGAEVALLYLDGNEVFRGPGINRPQIRSVGAAPPYAFADATIPPPLQFSVEPLIAGETITCHRGDGTNVVAQSPGVFHISPVPTTDESFTFTATNPGGETISYRYDWRRVTVPSWRNPSITPDQRSGRHHDHHPLPHPSRSVRPPQAHPHTHRRLVGSPVPSAESI